MHSREFLVRGATAYAIAKKSNNDESVKFTCISELESFDMPSEVHDQERLLQMREVENNFTKIDSDVKAIRETKY